MRTTRQNNRAFSRAERAGLARRLLPAIYCEPGLAEDLTTRVRALLLADPDAVLLGRAAAAASWWPELEVSTVAAVRRTTVAPAAGFSWSQRAIPLDRIAETDGVRFTDPALTVLDLIPDLGGSAIDEALRRRVVTLPELHAALAELPGRRANGLRRELLDDSRDEPWSEAERRFHRILREAALPWRFTTNHPVAVGEDQFFLDVALPELLLAFEVDGYEHHGDKVSFVADRVRSVQLSIAGWHVHGFAAVTIEDEAAWVLEAVRSLAWARARELGLIPALAA